MSSPITFLHPTPTHFTIYFPPIIFLIIHLFLFLMFLPISLRQLPIFSGLFPVHFFLGARHSLQVPFSPLNISNTLCLVHLQHCFFPTSYNIASLDTDYCNEKQWNTSLSHLIILLKSTKSQRDSQSGQQKEVVYFLSEIHPDVQPWIVTKTGGTGVGQTRPTAGCHVTHICRS